MPGKQTELCLPARPTDEILRDRLEDELRGHIHAFNTAQDPIVRVDAIEHIRELREKLRGAR